MGKGCTHLKYMPIVNTWHTIVGIYKTYDTHHVNFLFAVQSNSTSPKYMFLQRAVFHGFQDHTPWLTMDNYAKRSRIARLQGYTMLLEIFIENKQFTAVRHKVIKYSKSSIKRLSLSNKYATPQW